MNFLDSKTFAALAPLTLGAVIIIAGCSSKTDVKPHQMMSPTALAAKKEECASLGLSVKWNQIYVGPPEGFIITSGKCWP